MKKLICRIFLILIFALLINISNNTDANAATLYVGETRDFTIYGEEIEEHKIKIDKKMKIKITITIDPMLMLNDEDYLDYEWEYGEDLYLRDENLYGEHGKDFCYIGDDCSANFSLLDNDFDDKFNRDIKAGQSFSKTITVYSGKYELWIYNNGCDLNYSIKIEDVSPYTKNIKLNKKKVKIYEGKTFTLKASPKKKGNYIKKVVWKSSNKKIATVDNTGVVTTKKPGKCTITAKVPGGKKVKCKVIVKKRPPIRITEFSFSLDFLDGIEPYIKIENNTGKAIKYVYATIYFYNAVGDPVYCEISDLNYEKLTMIGPIKDGETATYDFDAVAYSGIVSKIKMKTVKVEFKDGTTKKYTVNKTGR